MEHNQAISWAAILSISLVMQTLAHVVVQLHHALFYLEILGYIISSSVLTQNQSFGRANTQGLLKDSVCFFAWKRREVIPAKSGLELQDHHVNHTVMMSGKTLNTCLLSVSKALYR